MMPQLDEKTGYLPPGVHGARWCGVAACYGGNSHRARLTAGLLAACRNLAGAGCTELLLGRSDPVLLDFSNRRAAMKAKYLGDLFPASAPAAPGVLYRDFFRTDRDGIVKGIVLVELGSLP